MQRYHEIGDHPKKVASDPPKGSIEPQQALSHPHLAPDKVLQNPSERVFRTTDRVLWSCSHQTPHFRVTLLKLSLCCRERRDLSVPWSLRPQNRAAAATAAVVAASIAAATEICSDVFFGCVCV